MVGRVGHQFAILAVLCTVVFFFIFPVVQGPYSVVQGPVTTLASIRARMMLWLGMALAAWRLLSPGLLTRCFAPFQAASNEVVQPLFFLPEQITVLRC
jgi:hypothetical protein